MTCTGLDCSGQPLSDKDFEDCTFINCNFTKANLPGAGFLNCDLTRTQFTHTVLEKVDFRTANNYSIDLEANRAKNAKFSMSGIIGLLDKYPIVIE